MSKLSKNVIPVKAEKQNNISVVPRLRFPEFRDAEAWTTKFGGVVFDQVNNKNHYSNLPVLAITQEYGAVPRNLIDYHVSVSEKSIDSYKVVEKGDFIISLRSFQGGIEFSRYDGICSPAYVILRSKNGYVEDYFRYYFKTNRFIAQMTRNLEGLRDGKMVSYKQFSELCLPIPERAEQQKIADCFSSLDALIATQAEKIDALKTHKKGLMQQLFPREGETVPHLRFSEFRDAGEWVDHKLEDLSKRGSGHTPNKKYPAYYNGGIKWVSLADSDKLDGGYLYQTKHEISEEGLKNSSTVLHPPETVILSRDAGVGKSAVLYSSMAVSQHFIIWRCDQSKLSNWFLYYLFQKMKPIFESIAVGNTIKTIGLPYFKEMIIVIPNVKEQKKIADCLSSIDALIAAQSQKLDTLKNHKKGLMQQIFPAADEVDA